MTERHALSDIPWALPPAVGDLTRGMIDPATRKAVNWRYVGVTDIMRGLPKETDAPYSFWLGRDE